MTTPLTLDEVKAEAHRVVKAVGPTHCNPGVDEDSVGGCFYTNSIGEHCIAGQVIKNLGRAIPGWQETDNGREVPRVAIFRGILTDKAEEYLTQVQYEADNAASWAVSVERVENTVEFHTED